MCLNLPLDPLNMHHGTFEIYQIPYDILVHFTHEYLIIKTSDYFVFKKEEYGKLRMKVESFT